MRLTERGRKLKDMLLRIGEGIVLCALFSGLILWFLSHL